MGHLMGKFAFIIHPIDPKRDVQRKFPRLGRILPTPAIHALSRFFPPVYISHVNGIISAYDGHEVEGWLVACPLTPHMMMRLSPASVYNKIVQTGRLAEKLGAELIGLGAYTAVVGDAGRTVAQRLNIPVTTGDSYTVAVAVEAVRTAAGVLGIDLPLATAAVVGANGAIGRVCARLLAPDVAEILLIGRGPEPLQTLQRQIEVESTSRVRVEAEMSALKKADLVLTATSALEAVVEPRHLKTGAVVCDVARPRDVSRRVAAEREDVLVIDGGIVSVPGRPNFNFDFGLPPGMVYACMAETIALVMEGRYENFTLGRELTLAQVEEIAAIASKHGFSLGGYRSFERAVTAEQLERVRALARRTRQAHLASTVSEEVIL
jgi:fatty aldehyde-generating acyl-ACP reductase